MNAKIVAAMKEKYPAVPIIGFPRGVHGAALWYATETGVDGIGCDTAMPPYMMAEAFEGERRAYGASDAETIVVQGNLDPLLLVAGGEALEERATQILDIV